MKNLHTYTIFIMKVIDKTDNEHISIITKYKMV